MYHGRRWLIQTDPLPGIAAPRFHTQLKRNLERQAEIYEKASDASRTIKVIVYSTAAEKKRVEGILRQLKLSDNPDVLLVDARRDNKPSGSKA